MEKYKIGIKVQVKNRKRVHPRFRNCTGKMSLKNKLLILAGLKEALDKGLISYGTYLSAMYNILDN